MDPDKNEDEAPSIHVKENFDLDRVRPVSWHPGSRSGYDEEASVPALHATLEAEEDPAPPSSFFRPLISQPWPVPAVGRHSETDLLQAESLGLTFGGDLPSPSPSPPLRGTSLPPSTMLQGDNTDDYDDGSGGGGGSNALFVGDDVDPELTGSPNTTSNDIMLFTSGASSSSSSSVASHPAEATKLVGEVAQGGGGDLVSSFFKVGVRQPPASAAPAPPKSAFSSELSPWSLHPDSLTFLKLIGYGTLNIFFVSFPPLPLMLPHPPPPRRCL